MDLLEVCSLVRDGNSTKLKSLEIRPIIGMCVYVNRVENKNKKTIFFTPRIAGKILGVVYVLRDGGNKESFVKVHLYPFYHHAFVFETHTYKHIHTTDVQYDDVQLGFGDFSSQRFRRTISFPEGYGRCIQIFDVL
jgi:hypothetical protein